MKTKVEKGLREKFSSFQKAAANAEDDTLRTFMASGAGGHPIMDNEQLEGIRRFAEMPIRGMEDTRKIISLASRLMPDTMWHTLVVFCRTPAGLAHLNRAALDAGVDLTVHGRYNNFLSGLGMTAFRLPPLPAFLDWFAGLDHVDFLGDGDRPVEITPPLDAAAIAPIGPLEAMATCMMGEEDLPGDLDVSTRKVRVAVIDSGIDAGHPALAGKIEQRFDLTMDQIGPVDPDGHGTHVAGIIAGDWPAGSLHWGGIAPFSSLTDIQLWSPLGQTSLTLVAGIGCAIQAEVDMINLSMGSNLPPDGQSLEALAVDAASNRGILSCIAAGNAGTMGEGTISVPSDASSAVCVAAVNADGSRAGFSSMGPTLSPDYTGPKPTISAPGVNIISLRSQYSIHHPLDAHGLYVAMSGTSMAAPVITGICSLGLAYLRSREISGVAPAVFREALRLAAQDARGQGSVSVGAGVVIVPAFLRNLVSLAAGKKSVKSRSHEEIINRYRLSMAGSPTFDPAALNARRPNAVNPVNSSTDPEIATGVSENPCLVTVKEPRPKVLADTEVLEDTLKQWKVLEGYFIQGVRSQLESYFSGMAFEIIGDKRCALGKLEEDDDSAIIRGKVLALGLKTGDYLGVMPVNQGFRATVFTKKGKPLLGVAGKSFAGSQALGKLSNGIKSPGPDEVGRFISGVKDFFPNIPCVITLMAPEAWTPVVGGLASGYASREVFFCQPRNGVLESKIPWFDVVNLSGFFHAWLALTPMPYEVRLKYCLECLLCNEKLSLPEGRVKLEKIAGILGLPRWIAEKLLAEVVDSDPRFGVDHKSPGNAYIVRIKMTK